VTASCRNWNIRRAAVGAGRRQRTCRRRGRRYDRFVSEAEGTLQEQLDEIGVQLAWVRDYL
jgi:hypothetical protein